MRGETVYRVYGVHSGREKDTYFGAYRSRRAAEEAIAKLDARSDWVAAYHNKGFVVREAIVETDFEVPPATKPRDKYFLRATLRPNSPGTWSSAVVEVFSRSDPELKLFEYVRNHPSLYQTFEPFRQGDREYALTSRDYTTAEVVELPSGNVIATSEAGFCPVGFYVPDWWDVHDDSKIPGSIYWDKHDESPTGQYGFIWGCFWGDDSSWKVRYLDLSHIQSGVLRCDERFGYVELYTTGYQSVVHVAPPAIPELPSKPPPFIDVSPYGPQVTFAVELGFDLNSGDLNAWQRTNLLRETNGPE